MDAALDAAEELYAGGNLPGEVYEDFFAEYEREKDDLDDAVGDRLLDEVNIKLDRVEAGTSTVATREEGYEEFWRERAREFGLGAVSQATDEESHDETGGEATGTGGESPDEANPGEDRPLPSGCYRASGAPAGSSAGETTAGL